MGETSQRTSKENSVLNMKRRISIEFYRGIVREVNQSLVLSVKNTIGKTEYFSNV